MGNRGRLLAAMRAGLVLALVATPLCAQLVVKLSQQTLSEFEHYASSVESKIKSRWSGESPFLALDGDPAARKRVLSGELYIKQMNDGQPVSITSGLIHDWLGAIYIPRTTPERVVGVLEDYNRHKDIYPAVTASHLVSRHGFDVVGDWRLEQKGFVPVILNVQNDVHFARIGSGKWKGTSYARDIREVDTGLFSRGRQYPSGEGHGFLWRLYNYWTLEAVNNGVIAECRTLSLSRDIPASLAWAVTPYVDKAPRGSLSSTLLDTRKALAP